MTSFLIAEVADNIRKGAGWVAMILFLINPNTLSSFLDPERDFVCFFSHLFRMRCLNISDTYRWRDIIISSSMLAMATLARPTTQYLILFFSFCLLFINYFGQANRSYIFKNSPNLVTTGLAVLLVAPWALKLAESEGSPHANNC